MSVALDRVTLRREEQERATVELHRAIRQAAEQHTLREVAAAAGLSAARVYQIVGKRGDDA
jgi:AcrR family transcriptional regulator